MKMLFKQRDIYGEGMLTTSQKVLKRATDVMGAAIGLLLFGWLMGIATIVARLETGETGIFCQVRVGRNGRLFQVLKIRTMYADSQRRTSVTIQGDPRITRFGRIWRRLKIDELPQLINVLKGDMSLVGPRPDVPQLASKLYELAPLVLSVRPGITGPASLKYRREEELLAARPNPEWVNDMVVFVDKARLNEQYVQNYTWLKDVKYLWQTISGRGDRCTHAELTEMIAAKSNTKNAA